MPKCSAPFEIGWKIFLNKPLGLVQPAPGWDNPNSQPIRL